MRFLKSQLLNIVLLSTLIFSFALANEELPFSHLSSDIAMGHKPMGMHLPQSPWYLEKIDAMESKLGRNLAVVHWFGSWKYEFEARPFENVIASGRTPLFTWQPMAASTHDIAEGIYDDFLRSYALGMRDLHGDVIIRLMPEMNGYWEPWNGDPQSFIAAWQHIITVFEQEGATNVRWMWAPNVTDSPVSPENAMELYYPGDELVDLLGLSGYNWGTVQESTAWTSFDAIYEAPYNRLKAITDKPIWIAEMASAERGGDKAAWIDGMLNSQAFPDITAFVWFQEHKEAAWKIDSSPQALNAFNGWYMNSSQ